MDTTALDVGRRAARALAANLRHRRRELGLSLERLSHISGVSRGMLGKIEREQSSPTLDVLGRISPALGLEVAALLVPTHVGADPSTASADDDSG